MTLHKPTEETRRSVFKRMPWEKLTQYVYRRLPNGPKLLAAGRDPDSCSRTGWCVYEWIDGRELDRSDAGECAMFLDWAQQNLWAAVTVTQDNSWYRMKTVQRSQALERDILFHDYPVLLSGFWHGDCTCENIIVDEDGAFCPIDWREDEFGDVYYDLGKFLRGLMYDMHKDEWLSKNPQSLDFHWYKQWCESSGYDWEIVTSRCGHAFVGMGGLHQRLDFWEVGAAII